jgi:hypothetical protein
LKLLGNALFAPRVVPISAAAFFIDDIEQVAGVIATQRLGLPVTFESGTTARHFFDFESAIMQKDL